MVTEENLKKAMEIVAIVRSQNETKLSDLQLVQEIAKLLEETPKEEADIEQVDIQGWKGKSGIEVYEQKIDYKVIEHRQNKETGDSYENEHSIPKSNVENLWKLIREKCEIGTEYKYKYLVRMILNYYKFHEKENQKLEVFMDAFNGGQWRAKYYFDYLYYPLKVLEKKGMIIYYGRGGVQRISDDLLI